MAWRDDPTHPFAGMAEKLKRADENIRNLEGEISGFFEGCNYPVIPDLNDDRRKDAIEYHLNLPIPRRFSILAGEVIHHWRSCLDHIVWMFSSPNYRSKHETKIQFPVFSNPPTPKDQERFDGQIGGIANPSDVRDLICKMQPYNFRPDPLDSPIRILHHMDIVDKHRELVIVHAAAMAGLVVGIPGYMSLVSVAISYSEQKPISDADKSSLHSEFDIYGRLIPQIAFAEFGKQKNQLVVPSLIQLGQAITEGIGSFAGSVTL